MKKPVRITITGAAGHIGYALLFRVSTGQMFGEDQPVILQLLEIPPAMEALSGVCMELEDCAFPLLRDVVMTDDLSTAFRDTDFAVLIGSKPRTAGMERQDLLSANAEIFSVQGKSINENASRDVKVVVVGNPANTNALIASANAPDIPRENFTAMTRLDHNRALGQLAQKTKTAVKHIHRMSIWGNHSPTQYPDTTHCIIKGKPARDILDPEWIHHTFIPTIQQRGAAIINARGTSSAASAADSIINHMNNWILGTPEDDWVSMAIPSDGSYGISEGIIFSFPVTCDFGEYNIVQGLEIDGFGQEKLGITENELLQERDTVRSLL